MANIILKAHAINTVAISIERLRIHKQNNAII